MSSIKSFVLPAMGEGIFEAKINKWLKGEGDLVEKQDPLVEVSTDKITTEIISPFKGKLMHLLVSAGETVTIGSELAQIAITTPLAEATMAQATVAKQSKHSAPVLNIDKQQQDSRQTKTEERIFASPLVRKLAAEHNIDLRDIKPAGTHLSKQDIEDYLLAKTSAVGNAPADTLTASTPVSRGVATEKKEAGSEYHAGVAVRRERMSGVRQSIAEHMLASVRTSPHVTTVFEIDMERVLAAKQAFAQECLQQGGFKLTYTPYFLHIAAQCLHEFPLLNTSLDGHDILWKDEINIGCAVALDDSLIVPVVKQADKMSLVDITQRLNELVVKARANKLSPDDVRGGTFSLTNPGIYGSITSNPIINQPQVAILGIGKIVPRAVVVEGMIAIRHQVLVSLTFDHRLIDGEMGAKFLALYKSIAEGYQ